MRAMRGGERGGEMGNGTWEWERGGDGASKDRAESPTACRNAKKKDYKSTSQQDYKKVES